MCLVYCFRLAQGAWFSFILTGSNTPACVDFCVTPSADLVSRFFANPSLGRVAGTQFAQGEFMLDSNEAFVNLRIGASKVAKHLHDCAFPLGPI